MAPPESVHRPASCSIRPLGLHRSKQFRDLPAFTLARECRHSATVIAAALSLWAAPVVAQTVMMVRMTGVGVLALAALSCGKDDPTSPEPQEPLATIQTIWPNSDGREWVYSLIIEEWTDTSSVGIFQSAAAVPPAPTLASLETSFPALIRGGGATADTGSLTLRFAGMVTTGSGVTAQNLQQTTGPGGGLRFLSGGAWKKTPSAILTYGDDDTFPTWEYLRADLVRGAEFSRSLLPNLASSVILHGRVVGRESVVTPFGAFPDAILCLYLLDFGISTISDDQGNLVGSARTISVAKIYYVDSVGPVACEERALLRVGQNGAFSNGAGVGIARLTARAPIPVSRLSARRHH